jgi:hypothetical protein
VVAFRRTIAPYWPTKCVFRLSAANGESKPRIGQTGQCRVSVRNNAYCAHFQSQRACKVVLWERNRAFKSNPLRQPVAPFLSLGASCFCTDISPLKPGKRMMVWLQSVQRNGHQQRSNRQNQFVRERHPAGNDFHYRDPSESDRLRWKPGALPGPGQSRKRCDLVCGLEQF